MRWLSFMMVACVIALLSVLACVISALPSQSRTAPSASTSLVSTIISNNTHNSNSSTPSEADRPYFPDSELVLDLAILSNAVYHLRNKVYSCHDAQAGNKTLVRLLQDESSSDQTEAHDIYQLLLPEGTKCLHYSHDLSLGTQVLVVRSTLHKYVAVAYAGTDDWKTALTDGDILTGNFGPSPVDNSTNNNSEDNIDISSIFQRVPDEVRVHRGFNDAVFYNDGFRTILNCVSSARSGGSCDDNDSAGGTNTDTTPSSSTYQLITTGHSLGAADSVLLGAALHLAYPNETLRSINFGCPKIGNTAWAFWVNSLQPDNGGQVPSVDGVSKKLGSFEIYRFVNKIDLVPRLPELPPLSHVGHTLQMSIGGEINAYYDHVGNGNLGYAGVPFGWGAEPYAFLPGALASHISHHYVEYLNFYKPNSTSSNLTALYYVRDFERVEHFDQELSSYA